METHPSLSSITDYPCLIHRNEKLTHLCTDLKCSANPYLCHQCFASNTTKMPHSSHQQLLHPILQAIPQMASLLQNGKNQMIRLFTNTVAKQEYDPLLQRLDAGDHHYAQIDSQIKGIKVQLERQVEILCGQFQRRLHTSKHAIFTQLDNYQKMYVQNMETYKVLIEPLFAFQRRYKFFSNVNNTSLKLLSELRRKSMEWYLDLKKTLTSTTKIMEKPQVMMENVHRSTQYMMAMGDQHLPRILNPDVTEAMTNKLQQCVDELLGNQVTVKDPKSLHAFALEAENAIRGVNSNIIVAGTNSNSSITTNHTVQYVSANPSSKDFNQRNITRLVVKKSDWMSRS